MNKQITCCFIGHRNIDVSEELKLSLTEVIESLIENEGVDTFLFGSKSQFCVAYCKKEYLPTDA